MRWVAYPAMKPVYLLSIPATAFAFILTPVLAYGQGQAVPPTTPGWGSTWTEPANEQERELKSTERQTVAAQKAGNSLAAIALCNQQIQKTPNSVEAYVLRAQLYAELKRYDPALEDLEHAKSITRQNQTGYVTANLCVLAATLHERKRDYAGAVDELQAALRLEHNNPRALNNLAWLRATALNPALRNGREGITMAKRALALEPNGPTYGPLDTLAAAYAESNDYQHAVECEKRALDDAGREIKDAAKAQDFHKQASERLALFEQQRPYHADLP